MTIVVESFETGLAGGSTADDVTVNKPASVASGDLLMLLVTNGEHLDGDIFPARSGWVKQFELGDSTSDSRICCYTRIADGSEASSETITWDTANRSGAAWYLRITGHHATSYWDTLGTARIVTSATNRGLSITPSVDDCLVFTMCGWDGAAASFTSVSGTNWPSSIPANQDLQDGAADFSGILTAWVTQLQTTAAASNDCTFTTTASDGTVAVQFAIAPTTVIPPTGIPILRRRIGGY